jgi:hypothetical protein
VEEIKARSRAMFCNKNEKVFLSLRGGKRKAKTTIAWRKQKKNDGNVLRALEMAHKQCISIVIMTPSRLLFCAVAKCFVFMSACCVLFSVRLTINNKHEERWEEKKLKRMYTRRNNHMALDASCMFPGTLTRKL